MSVPLKATLAAALIVSLLPAAASAQPRHKAYRHHARTHLHGHAPRYARRDGYRAYGSAYADPYAGYSGDPDDPYNPYAPPGAALRAQARINQNAPGVTNELAPGNIATATGGPSGGVPGFSGR